MTSVVCHNGSLKFDNNEEHEGISKSITFYCPAKSDIYKHCKNQGLKVENIIDITTPQVEFIEKEAVPTNVDNDAVVLNQMRSAFKSPAYQTVTVIDPPSSPSVPETIETGVEPKNSPIQKTITKDGFWGKRFRRKK